MDRAGFYMHDVAQNIRIKMHENTTKYTDRTADYNKSTSSIFCQESTNFDYLSTEFDRKCSMLIFMSSRSVSVCS